MPALTTEELLRKEADAVHGSGKVSADVARDGLYRALNALNSTALCLSGGGVRSAAFGLGVIQALAAHPRREGPNGAGDHPVDRAEDSLLAQVHYLSAVAGGAHIAGWLSAWRRRADFAAVWAGLIGRPRGAALVPDEIARLRSSSNHLAAKIAITSVDAWTGMVLTIRNVVLNGLVILPAVCVGILLLKIGAVLSDQGTRNSEIWLQVFVASMGTFFLVRAIAFTTHNRPSRRADPAGAAAEAFSGRVDTGLPSENASKTDSSVDQPAFLRGSIVWALLSAIAFTQFLASDYVGLQLLVTNEYRVPVKEADHLEVAASMATLLLGGALCGAALYGAGWIAGRPRKREFADLALWMVAGMAYGTWVTIGFYQYLQIPGGSCNQSLICDFVMHLVVGVPWILLGQVVADTVFVGLSSQRPRSEPDREWLGRGAGWLLATAVTWFLVMFVTFGGFLKFLNQDAVASLYANLGTWLAPIGGVSAILTAVIGRSSLTGRRGPAQDMPSLVAGILLTIAAPVFVAVGVFALSLWLDNLLLGEFLLTGRYNRMTRALDINAEDYRLWTSTNIAFAEGLAIAAVIGAAASYCVNVNRFSLHALYRNRLIRVFLSASRRDRADSFSGFSETDNIPMRELWPASRADETWAEPDLSQRRPFLVVNMTVNLVSAGKLGWQNRKVESFTASPLYCGTSSKCREAAPASGRSEPEPIGAYRQSSEYAGAISLGTAMAISGAAESPDTGYHPSAAVTFLMTLLNSRLGWWLGNPADEGEETYSRDGPVLAIFPLVQQIFGLTTDHRRYVYLSDGRHFEGLGLYEMVRRRCRHVIVVDAGSDPNFGFDDLANAVRKIDLDLGIAIRFGDLSLLKKRPTDGSDVGPGQPYHAIGEIDYPAADGSGEKGIILYLKPGYHGIESAVIRGYAVANADFPHEDHSDRWVGEAQFESYRALGFEIMEGVFRCGLGRLGPAETSPTLAQIFEALRHSSSACAAFGPRRN